MQVLQLSERLWPHASRALRQHLLLGLGYEWKPCPQSLLDHPPLVDTSSCGRLSDRFHDLGVDVCEQRLTCAASLLPQAHMDMPPHQVVVWGSRHAEDLRQRTATGRRVPQQQNYRYNFAPLGSLSFTTAYLLNVHLQNPW